MAERAETEIDRKRRLSYEAARAAVAFGEANPDNDELDLTSYSQGYRDAAEQAEAEVRALREALLHHLFDLHNHSTRPCPTCSRSRKTLGLDTSTSEGMLGCGYSIIENRIAWRTLAPEPPEGVTA